MRPYISIDIETTGLDIERSHILQLGWVLDDGVSPIENLKTGNFLIENPVITYGESYAIAMNAWIFAELAKKPSDRKMACETLGGALGALQEDVFTASRLAEAYDKAAGAKHPSDKVQVAGKNVGNFDYPIIKHKIDTELVGTGRATMLKLIDHRFLDVGSIYYSDFGRNPGFNSICELVGIPAINHNALDDAMAVVKCLRHKLKVT